MNENETIDLINKTLDKIRPFIQRDGGDLEFVKFENGIVYVKLTGACEGCMAIDQTLGNGIEVILMDEVPGVLGVKLAD
jgi:Fe-S cluster biogenesis protein NfuA